MSIAAFLAVSIFAFFPLQYTLMASFFLTKLPSLLTLSALNPYDATSIHESSHHVPSKKLSIWISALNQGHRF
jgi:hypothetical protein